MSRQRYSIINTKELNTLKKAVNLLEAVKNNHIDYVKKHLTKASLTTQDDKGRTLLHLAVSEGHIELVTLLIAKGIPVNARDHRGRTPFLSVGRNKDTEIAELLLSHGADIDTRSCINSTALHFASLQGNITITEFLLAKGIDVNTANNAGETPLIFAAYIGKEDLVNTLLAHGADIEAHASVKGFTPLTAAVSGGCLGSILILIKHGAQVKAEDNGGATPLHYAAYRNRLEAAEILLKNGALINARAKDGRTPLHSAVYGDSLEMIEFLISRGADICAEDFYRETPLRKAESKIQKKTAEFLSRFHVKVQRRIASIRKLLEEKRYYDAWLASMKAIKECPSCSDLLKLAAETDIHRGYLQEAFAIRKELICNRYNEHFMFWRHLHLGHLCKEFGKFTQARMHYLKAHKEKPDDYDTISSLYRLSCESGRKKDVSRYLEKLLTRFPDNAYALQSKAWEYEKEGRWLEALDAYRKSGSDHSHVKEGLILLNMGRITEAKESLQKVPLASGERKNACEELVMTYDMMGDYEEAHHYLKSLRDLDQNCLVEMKMAHLHMKAGEKEKSQNTLIKGLSRYIDTYNPERKVCGKDLVELLLEKLRLLEQGGSLLHYYKGSETISELKIKVLCYIKGKDGIRYKRKAALEPSYIKKCLEDVRYFFSRESGCSVHLEYEELPLRNGLLSFHELSSHLRFGREQVLEELLDIGSLKSGEGVLILHQDYGERDCYHTNGLGMNRYALIQTGRKNTTLSCLIAHELCHAIMGLSHTNRTEDIDDAFSVMGNLGAWMPLSCTYMNPFQKALMVTLPSVQKMVEEGKSLEERGLCREAAGVYREALQEDPLYQWIYVRVSEIYEHLGESDNACNILKEAVKINPVDYYECSLAAYFLEDKKTRGKEEVFRHVRGFGENSHTHSLINHIFYERRDYHECLRNSLIAWWLDKGSFYATSYVAVAWHNLHELSCASFWYRKLLKIAPLWHETYYRVAYLEAQRGNMKTAKRCLKKAETLAPRDPEARYWRKLINKARRRKPDGQVRESAGNSGGLLFRA